MSLFATHVEINSYGRKLTKKEIKKILEFFAEKSGCMKFWLPDIASSLNKEIDFSVLDTVEEKISAKTPEEEKREYKVYSHENSKNPKGATANDVEELEERALNEKAFDIFFDAAKREIIVNGKRKNFIPEKGKVATYKRRLLSLFLQNVGGFVSSIKMSEIVWGEGKTNKGTIQQMKRRVCEFTEKAITPFIEWDKATDYIDGYTVEGYNIYKEDGKGNKFKYCLIQRSKNSES
jgi:hypothetical protein